MQTYNLLTEYEIDDTGTLSSNRNQAAEYAVKTAFSDAFNKTKVTLSAKGYSKLGFSVDENPNTALRANYESEVLLEGGKGKINIQHSGTASDYTMIDRFPMNSAILGIYPANVRTQKDAHQAVTKVDNAINQLSKKRAYFGAEQNRMEHSLKYNMNASENMTSAESRIRDTDMAEEMAVFTKNNIIQQAAQSMLTQANQWPQGVLQLLQA